MRILHVLDHSLPLHSGYSFRTMSILREQRALGWETLQLTSPKQGESKALQEDVDGWLFYRTPPSHSLFSRLPVLSYLDLMAATERRIEELVRSERPDILQPHSPILNAFPAFKVGRRHGIPVVYEMRSSWEDAAVDHGTTREGSARYRLSRYLETLALRRADHVTTICEGLRRDIVSRGIPEAKVTVIPNAVDTRTFVYGAQATEGLARKLGIEGKIVLGFAGSFYGYEGLDLLVEALARIRQRRQDVCLLLVGGGFQEQALKQQVQALGLSQDVVFAGRVPHAQVQEYYRLIDVLVYPRHSMRLTEVVTPLKPLEAMAQGRLMVASDVGGHKELIRHGDTGILFKAGDAAALAQAVLDLLDAPATWERMRKAGRAFVESERTWTRSVARYADVYRGLLAASGPLADARGH